MAKPSRVTPGPGDEIMTTAEADEASAMLRAAVVHANPDAPATAETMALPAGITWPARGREKPGAMGL